MIPENFFTKPNPFISNQFLNEYEQLVLDPTKANRKKSYDGPYYERHHIVPVSLGGLKRNSNTVLLTVEEHYNAHVLLTKFTQGNNNTKMWLAVYRMMNGNANQQRHELDFSILEKAKREHAKTVSIRFKGKPFSEERKASMRANHKGMSDEHKQIMSEVHSGKTPWNKGKKAIYSQEALAKMRDAKLGENHPLYGKHLSEKTKEKMAEAHKGQVPWNKDKTYTRKPHSEEHKLKLKEAWARRRLLKLQK